MKECESLKKEVAELRNLLAVKVENNAELEAQQQVNKKRKTSSSLPTP
jgi:hypothetical protein